MSFILICFYFKTIEPASLDSCECMYVVKKVHDLKMNFFLCFTFLILCIVLLLSYTYRHNFYLVHWKLFSFSSNHDLVDCDTMPKDWILCDLCFIAGPPDDSTVLYEASIDLLSRIAQFCEYVSKQHQLEGSTKTTGVKWLQGYYITRYWLVIKLVSCLL